MAKKLKVKVTQTAIIKVTQEDLDMLRDACFEDGDRQMLHETLSDASDEQLTIEKIDE